MDKTGLPASPELLVPLSLAASDATAGPETGGVMTTSAVPTCPGVAGACAQWHVICHQTKILPGELGLPFHGQSH